MKFSTKAIHIGSEPDETTASLAPPLYLTSTYAQQALGAHKGFEYSRVHHPGYERLERNLAALEEGRFATVFSSGMAAIDAVFTRLVAGDSIAIPHIIYGGTHRLLHEVYEPLGIKIFAVDTQNLMLLEKLLAEKKPRLLFMESISNPLLAVNNVPAISQLTRSHGVELVVDNTFATPFFLNPLVCGADVVVHSSSKYLAGHSDIIGGALISSTEDWKIHADRVRKTKGTNPSPFDVWLIQRSIKTLPVRMERHADNALRVSKQLSSRKLVKKVYYPGLPDHESHATAKRLLKGFGGVISVDFDMPYKNVQQLASSFKHFSLAESLGGVESMVSHPASMSHASVPKQQRKQLGITDTMLRFSIGIEDSDDLIQDMNLALKKFGG